MKKEIYILVKPEEVERINEEIKKYQDVADVKVITDINEIPQSKRENLEIANAKDGTRKSLKDIALDKMTEEKFSEIVKQYYSLYKMPEVPVVEELVKENKTEFQKLSSFDRKEKNQARKRLEHQALKYQNKHYRK